jgi:hypothetical protein
MVEGSNGAGPGAVVLSNKTSLTRINPPMEVGMATVAEPPNHERFVVIAVVHLRFQHTTVLTRLLRDDAFFHRDVRLPSRSMLSATFWRLLIATICRAALFRVVPVVIPSPFARFFGILPIQIALAHAVARGADKISVFLHPLCRIGRFLAPWTHPHDHTSMITTP